MSTVKNPKSGVVLDVFGPVVEFLTLPNEQNDYCIMKGEFPSGIVVPLHSHGCTEDFFIISGEIEALRKDDRGYEWIKAEAGDHIHVPGNTQHAWRNFSSEPAVIQIVITKKMGHFFQEIGRPSNQTPQPVTQEELINFATVSAKYNYWNATPEENAAVGIKF